MVKVWIKSIRHIVLGFIMVFGLMSIGMVSMTSAKAAEVDYNTNLGSFTANGGTWTYENDGYNGVGEGDCFAISSTTATNFIFETDINVKSGIAASLVFCSNDKGTNSYVANVDFNLNNARIFKFTPNGASTIGSNPLPTPVKRTYNLRVEKNGNTLLYFVDDVLMVKAEDTQYNSGKLGFLNYNSHTAYQNSFYTNLDDNSARITGMSVTGITLDKPFNAATALYSSVVENEVDKISLDLTSSGDKIYIQTVDSHGEAISTKREYNPSEQISLNVGVNNIVITTQKNNIKGATTILEVKRLMSPQDYYNEKYRPQYHITPEEGWLNDPNGLVYYEGEYHAFYQYRPDVLNGYDKWWAHAVSTDLVNWEHRPVALAPDDFGSMWSGSAIVDEHNVSGLFTNTPEKKGLLAFYTVAGGRQQQSLAYSTDKGNTWTKYNGGAPIIDIAQDPLDNPDFRDPKVFWHEESNQWMMVLAGGPLRFYSSTNLINWKAEAMQSDIHTECPDFYRIAVDGNPANKKWVLAGGGRWYMIGEFELVEGKWTFIPDGEDAEGEDIHKNRRQTANMSLNAYASQTFANVGDRIIKLDWIMDRFDDRGHASLTKTWNYFLSIPTELTLKTVDGKIRVIENPVEELEKLRTYKHSFSQKEASASNEFDFNALALKKFEMNVTIDAGTASEFGLKLRVGGDKYTTVKYTKSNSTLTVDRTNSGANPYNDFAEAFSTVVPLENNKLKLTIYVDHSSIEVFAQDGFVPCFAIIYPDPLHDGMSFFANGGTASIISADVYELKSVFRDIKIQNVALNVSGLTFNKGVTSYNLTVAGNVDKIGVKTDFTGIGTAKINDTNALNNQEISINLNVGDNTIQIKTYNEYNREIETITLNINRQDPNNSNNGNGNSTGGGCGTIGLDSNGLNISMLLTLLAISLCLVFKRKVKATI